MHLPPQSADLGSFPAGPSAYDDPYARGEHVSGSVSPRGRFGLPSFSRESSREGRRTPHSGGGAKQRGEDEDETEGLVSSGQAPGRRESFDSDPGLERFETRD